MPQPVAKKCSIKLSNKLKGSAQLIAEQSMAAAVRDVTGIKGTSDIGVSVDGTCQKRGFASLDVEMISRKCKACVAKESLHKERLPYLLPNYYDFVVPAQPRYLESHESVPCILLNVVAAIKPIYFDLTKEDVLSKGLHGLVMKVSMQLYGNGALTLPGSGGGNASPGGFY